MTVCDCLQEYELFCNEVFGHQRKLRESTTSIINREKYDARRLEKAVREVTYFRCEERDIDSGPVTFTTAPGLCKRCVAFPALMEKGFEMPGFEELFPHGLKIAHSKQSLQLILTEFQFRNDVTKRTKQWRCESAVPHSLL
jgi:hypothetical protein